MTSLVVLGGVCVAAFLVVRLAGRFLATGRARGAHLLDVVARVPLEPRRSLYVVEVAGKTLLVGTSEMGLSVLSELDPGEVRARMVVRPTFGELVRAAWLRRRAAKQGPSEPEASRSEAENSTPSPVRTPARSARPIVPVIAPVIAPGGHTPEDGPIEPAGTAATDAGATTAVPPAERAGAVLASAAPTAAEAAPAEVSR